jgi:phosphoglycolate phosphatase
LVIFDCDGTLVDSQHMICAAMRQAYEAHNLSVPPREHLLAIVGLSLPDAFRRLAERAGAGDNHPVDGLVTCYKSSFAALRTFRRSPELAHPGASRDT